MADEPDSVRIELAFDGGPGLSALVTIQGADELERALATQAGGTVMLDSMDGRYTVVLDPRRLHEALRARVARRVRDLAGRARLLRMTETTQKATGAEIRKLVERGQKGDRTALEELYLIHFDRIYSYLHMTVGNRHDAEDLTTQTFLRMLESIGKFRFQAAPFSAWLFRIAHNLSMDHFRANRRWQPEEEVPEPHDSEERSAEDEAFQSIGRQSMLELIDSLSHEQQQVLTLKFVFNFSNAEVATILDKTEGAVKSLQHRALVSLQKQLAGDAAE